MRTPATANNHHSVPTLPGPPRTLPREKTKDGFNGFVIPRSTYHPDGKVKAGYCESPYSTYLMWGRTTKRNVIGLCELVLATTHGSKGIGDYDEVVLTIEDIQSFLKISRSEAYATREEAVALKWLQHRKEPGVGEVYRFFLDKVEATPELPERRTRT